MTLSTRWFWGYLFIYVWFYCVTVKTIIRNIFLKIKRKLLNRNKPNIDVTRPRASLEVSYKWELIKEKKREKKGKKGKKNGKLQRRCFQLNKDMSNCTCDFAGGRYTWSICLYAPLSRKELQRRSKSTYMLFAVWKNCIAKTCDRGLDDF